MRLVTPDRLVLDATAEAVELPSMSGYLEALYGAAPLLAELGAGEVRAARRLRGRPEVLRRLGLRRGAAGAGDHPGRDGAASEGDRSRRSAKQELRKGEKLWQEAGDDGEKYDEANAVTRQAEEKIASAQGRSL